MITEAVQVQTAYLDPILKAVGSPSVHKDILCRCTEKTLYHEGGCLHTMKILADSACWPQYFIVSVLRPTTVPPETEVSLPFQHVLLNHTGRESEHMCSWDQLFATPRYYRFWACFLYLSLKLLRPISCRSVNGHSKVLGHLLSIQEEYLDIPPSRFIEEGNWHGVLLTDVSALLLSMPHIKHGNPSVRRALRGQGWF